MHRGTFYKCTFQNIQKLDSSDLQRAIWAPPNNSPRFSVLHLSCNSGAVTAVNLATGQAIQKALSSTSISARSEISSVVERPSLAEESFRMMKLRSKWASGDYNYHQAAKNVQTSFLTPSSPPSSDYGNEYDEAWNEVNKEIKNLQKMFAENINNFESYENVYRTD
uniref:Uncharacterized protein n=1 Tax=Panagrolaimus sp. ES5 TaxID=591445 RepID=A0AC34GLG6_9BILA